MTNDRAARIAALFDAVSAVPPAEREAYLDAHEADPAVRDEVRALLAYDTTSDFLERPVLERSTTVVPLPERIGPYRIVRMIGQGGMGTVYEAVQDAPQRTVALKVLRPELASTAVTRRFEHEAQVLAQLRHPGIAHVYAAGVDAAGAWFAMELVHGAPIDTYCSTHDLTLDARLDLLARVADALDHAHACGVIHRDVKPANVLVDEHGAPKLLDFGVARVMDPDGHPATIQTHAGQLIGTVPYMSPEQISGTTGAIDARSDVYALGVLGFRMLSGELPLDVSGRTIADAARVITEDSATRLGRFETALRGDVETIIGTALEKDPARRYPSAGAFAADVRRYLAKQPITARRPSTLYQARRFAQRNRRFVAALAAAFAVLVIGLIATSVLAVHSARAEAEAIERQNDAEAMNAFLQRLLAAPNPFETETGSPDTTIVEMLDRAEHWIDDAFDGRPELEAPARHTLGRTYKGIAQFDRAATYLESAVDLYRAQERPERLASALGDLATTYAHLERHEPALHAADAALAGHRALDPTGAAVARALVDLGFVQRRAGDRDGAIASTSDAITRLRTFGAAAHEDLAIALANLAGMQREAEAYDACAALYREAIELLTEHLGARDPHTLIVRNNLARLLVTQGERDDAALIYDDVLAGLTERLGRQHARVADVLNNLASLRFDQQRYDDAEAAFEESLAIYAAVFSPAHPEYGTTLNNLAFLHYDMGQHDRAAAEWQQFGAILAAEHGPRYWRIQLSHAYAAESLALAGRGGEGVPLIESAFTILRDDRGIDDAYTQSVVRAAVRFYSSIGDSEGRARFEAVRAE